MPQPKLTPAETLANVKECVISLAAEFRNPGSWIGTEGYKGATSQQIADAFRIAWSADELDVDHPDPDKLRALVHELAASEVLEALCLYCGRRLTRKTKRNVFDTGACRAEYSREVRSAKALTSEHDPAILRGEVVKA